MRKLFGIFKKGWFISLLGVIFLALVIWFAGPLLAFAGYEPLAGEITRMIVIMVLMLAWGLNNLRVQMQAKKANEGIIEGIKEAEGAEGAGGGADQNRSAEEVAVLKERFEEAMEVLKKSKGKKGGGTNLYELPWYIIIGPPGSGKTTALVNSGLRFPLAERFGSKALQGVGGTRNCDWWFTDEAILLDTAGRYVTQDSDASADSAAWGGFLDLLKRHRRRRPINGVLVAISLSDLMLQGENERAAHARTIKQRIQELHKRLGIRFPVYVMFTKSDLVAGFMEFYDDLGKEERTQVWGTTFPLADGPEAVVQHFPEEFDALAERVNNRLVWRLHNERDPGRRALVYRFPQQFASLREILDTFLQEVFRPSRFEEPAMLRGVYFTSGTQEGTPIDRMMGALARSFGLDQQLLSNYGGSGRSYFITRLLRDVVFGEAALAGSNRKLERRRAWVQRGAYAAAIVAMVLAGLAWTTSFTRNQAFVSQIDEAVDSYNAMSEEPLPPRADFDALLPRLDKLRAIVELQRQVDADRPLLMGFGLYQGDKLGSAAADAYQRELTRLFAPRIAGRIGDQMVAAAGDTDLQYEALKLYLMLGDPERLDQTLLTAWMQLDWQVTYAADANKRGRLEAHLASLLEPGLSPVPLDQGLVDGVRARLTQVPLAQLVYGRLKREYQATEQAPFKLTDVTGPPGERVFIRESGAPLDQPIPALYTYRGFFEGFQKESGSLVSRMRKESWVLGKDTDALSKAELDQLDKDLLDLYVRDFIREWDKLLGDLRIVPFNGVQHASEVLDALSGPRSPMRSLLQAVERNTSLTKLPGGVGEAAKKVAEAAGGITGRLARLLGKEEVAAAAGRLPGQDVEDHFARINELVRREGGSAAPLDRLIDMLAEAYGYLSALSSGVANPQGAEIMSRIGVEAARQPEPVRGWLQQISGSSRSVRTAKVRGDTTSKIQASWNSQVLPSCNRALVNRYPLYPEARQEVNLLDFGRFFGPGGVMDAFFAENLKEYVDTARSPWQWKTVDNVNLGLSASVLELFETASLIRDTFFQGEGKTPSVSFSLKPVFLDASATQFLLDLDGQQFVYRHGPPRLERAQWPGPGGTGQVRIVFEETGAKRSTLSEDGPWAWFRILDRSKVQSLSSDRLVTTFEAGGHEARYEIRASSVVNPFLMRELKQFRCPERL